MADKQAAPLGNGNPTQAYFARPKTLWSNHTFVLLWSGQVISTIGTQISLLAFPWLLLTLTGSPAQAGLIAALRVLPYILFGLPAGALVDRWDRKWVMLCCDIGRALALGSIPIALAGGFLTVAQLYGVSFIEGTLFIFFGLAQAASLPHVVSREQLPAATAQNEFVTSLSGLLGPSLSGFLYGLGNSLPFLADALSYTVSVLTLLFVRGRFQEKRTASPRRLSGEITEGIAWLWRHPVLRFLAFLIGGLNFSVAGYVLIVLVLAREMHAPHFTVGLILAGGGIGSTLGAFMAAPLAKRFRFGPLLSGATWIWALTWLLFIAAPNPLLLGGAVLCAFLIVPVHTSLQYTYRLSHIPDQLQGRVNGVMRLILFGSQTLGLMLTGFLLQAVGPVLTVMSLFLPQLILAILTTMNAHMRKEPGTGKSLQSL
jgi:MFS family permease